MYILNDCTVKHMKFTFLCTLCILQRMLYQRGVWVYKEQALRRSQCHFHPLVTFFSALCALLPNIPDPPTEKQYHGQFTQPVNKSQGSLHWKTFDEFSVIPLPVRLLPTVLNFWPRHRLVCVCIQSLPSQMSISKSSPDVEAPLFPSHHWASFTCLYSLGLIPNV